MSRPQAVVTSVVVLCLTLLIITGKVGEEHTGVLVEAGTGYVAVSLAMAVRGKADRGKAREIDTEGS